MHLFSMTRDNKQKKPFHDGDSVFQFGIIGHFFILNTVDINIISSIGLKYFSLFRHFQLKQRWLCLYKKMCSSFTVLLNYNRKHWYYTKNIQLRLDGDKQRLSQTWEMNLVGVLDTAILNCCTLETRSSWQLL